MVQLSPCDVLIVEDEMIQCEEMASFLARSGLAVQSAHDGSTALRQAAIHRPKIVLLDYNLPDTTGVLLAEQIRALLPTATIMMMSGRIDGLSEQTLEATGITIFVNKPLPLGALRQAILKLARSAPSEPRAKPRAGGWFSAGLGGTRH
jgi:DNA-binding response OmpR family regulator